LKCQRLCVTFCQVTTAILSLKTPPRSIKNGQQSSSILTTDWSF